MNCAEKSNPSGSGVYKRAGASQRLLRGVINRRIKMEVHHINAKQQMVAGVKAGHHHLAAVERYLFVFLKHLNPRHSLHHPMSAH
jgi:hypothetical protein